MSSQLLSEALKRSGRFEVTASLANSAELLSAVSNASPDVVVLSPTLDDQEGKGFTISRQLCSSHPETNLIILADSSSRELVVEAFRVGARGVFCRTNSIKDLCKCIEVVCRGQIWANNGQVEFVLEALTKALPSRLVDSKGISLLSKREQDVIRSLSEGLTNREIAAELKLSEHTVKNYLLRIFDKLGVSNRSEAILYAFSQSGAAPAVANAPQESAVFHGDEARTFEAFYNSAQQGYGLAQFVLGQMYRDGYGVTEDVVSAYTWFLLAERSGEYAEASIREARERLSERMGADQIAEAQSRALAWTRDRSRHWQSATLSSGSAATIALVPKPARTFPLQHGTPVKVTTIDSSRREALESGGARSASPHVALRRQK